MKSTAAQNHEYLKPILKEHQFGLLFCWRIRQGLSLKVKPGRISRYVRVFWQSNLSSHFREEEQLLLRDGADPLVQQALQEHVRIRSLVEEIVHDDESCSSQQFNLLADHFSRHIQFEERELFPYLERKLSMQEFNRIEEQLRDSNAAQLKNDFEDQFWRDPNASL